MSGFYFIYIPLSLTGLISSLKCNNVFQRGAHSRSNISHCETDDGRQTQNYRQMEATKIRITSDNIHTYIYMSVYLFRSGGWRECRRIQSKQTSSRARIRFERMILKICRETYSVRVAHSFKTYRTKHRN